MEQLIYEVLMRNLEVINIKDGDNTTAIALTESTFDYPQSIVDLELSARTLATKIAEELSIR